jgi:hypothetical protein
MQTAWPNECLSLRRVQQVCKEYQDGERDSFERVKGSGISQSEKRTENVNAVNEMISMDDKLTLREIANELQITHTMVERILCEDLNKTWMRTKWVPHELSLSNKTFRVERCTHIIEALSVRQCRRNLITIDEKWFYLRHLIPSNKIGSWVTGGGDEPQRKTAKRSTMEKKFMDILAVTQRGQHYYELLNQNESVNSQRYVQFLYNLEAHLKQFEMPILFENARLIQDNARPHVSAETLEFLNNKNVRLLKQPPYSPDCNLCDRYIFGRLESKRKNNFENKEAIMSFLDDQMPLFTSQRMAKALDQMMADMHKIIDIGGDYI